MLTVSPPSSPIVSSVSCVIEKCELVSLALCQCCKKDLCIDHLNEHANRRNEKLLPLVDQINGLLQRFTQFYDGEKSALAQLNHWRDEASKTIDSFYEKKRDEHLAASTDKHRDQLNDMQMKLNDLIRKKGGSQQDFERFSENMQLIEQHLDKLEHVPIILLPLTIDEQSILRPVSAPNDLQDKATNTSPPEKSPKRKEKSEKSSRKKAKSARYSDNSSDRSSRHQSRSPRERDSRSRKSKSLDNDEHGWIVLAASVLTRKMKCICSRTFEILRFEFITLFAEQSIQLCRLPWLSFLSGSFRTRFHRFFWPV